MSTLVIRREKSLAYGARRVNLQIDGQNVTTLSNGSSYCMSLHSGYHTVEFKIGARTIGTQQIIITENSEVTVRFIIDGAGLAAIDTTQTSADVGISPQPRSNNSIPNVNVNNKNFLWGLCFVILILTLLWIFMPALRIEFRLIPNIVN